MAASQHAAITDPNFDNYVIFVTDGYQYCSVNGGSGCATAADCTFMGVSSCPQCLPDQQDGCYCTRNWPVIGTQALADAGVTTYVVGFGDKVAGPTVTRPSHSRVWPPVASLAFNTA